MTRSLSFSSSIWISGEPGRGGPEREGSNRCSKAIVCSFPSELEARRARRVGEGANAPVVEVSVAVEHDLLDPLREQDLGDRLAHLLGSVALRRVGDAGANVLREGRRVREGRARGVVDDLGVD